MNQAPLCPVPQPGKEISCGSVCRLNAIVPENPEINCAEAQFEVDGAVVDNRVVLDVVVGGLVVVREVVVAANDAVEGKTGRLVVLAKPADVLVRPLASVEAVLLIPVVEVVVVDALEVEVVGAARVAVKNPEPVMPPDPDTRT